MILLYDTAYQRSGFWAFMFIIACIYIIFAGLTYNHLVKQDYHNWVDYGKLKQDEAKALGLFLSIIWPAYWFAMLFVTVAVWIVKSLIALFKVIFLS